ncbi:Coiled-coil domain-containing protein 86 [Chionoecetes opilio]|uniref:Coiled-coil domain-containing protein 86 n=1 Tax=Chionoecetes opilio TaxID=41210 RepID=A0A8J4Y4U5_CHIOP|nr:Coiled-coil domain-containing protein 86 [Chionoecetes opilio]
MVVTRKRKQDDSGGGTTTGTPGSMRTTARCVSGSGTPVTTRRSRRVTDTVTTTPKTSAVKQKVTIPDAKTPVVKQKVTIPDIKTPEEPPQTESKDDELADTTESPLQRKCVVKLKNIATPIPQAGGEKDVSGSKVALASTPRRSRRLSGSLEDASKGDKDTGAAGSTPKVSTPRRSRRLSGSGLDDSSQDTPSKKSFTIARILGVEEKPKEEVIKRNILPVIEEDAEQVAGSPKKNVTKEVLVSEDQEEEEVDSAIPIVTQAKSESQTKRVVPEKSTLINQEAKTTVDSPVDDGDVKLYLSADDSTDAHQQKPDEVMETEDIVTSSAVDNTASDNSNKEVETKGELNGTIDSEKPRINSKKVSHVTESNAGQETKAESKESSTVDGSHVPSNTPLDENANKDKMSGLNTQPLVSAGVKKAYKVIPEMEKKIDQLRSIPKGRSVSGRWWKAEKQRFRSINKDASGKKSWSRKMQLKQWRGDVMAKSAAIEAEKLKKKEDLKERQKLNKTRREENARKSEIVQVIKDPRKIKKMKRKQLRYLATRDTTNMQPVQP